MFRELLSGGAKNASLAPGRVCRPRPRRLLRIADSDQTRARIRRIEQSLAESGSETYPSAIRRFSDRGWLPRCLCLAHRFARRFVYRQAKRPRGGSVISLELVELSPALGVEVRGVDLGRPLSEASLREIRAAWNNHHLLLFRGRDLTSDDQLRFIRHFGEPLRETLDGSPFSYVSNVREDAIIRSGALFFHSDLAFTPDPLRAISLFAVETTEGAAPTSFMNAIRGCETLPAALAERIDGPRALHTFDLVNQRGDQRYRVAELPPDAPRATHPVVWSHPELGRSILYVNSMQTDRIEGLPEVESRALLEELLEHLYRPEHIYQHDWRPGDFIFWDNWALQHARPDVSEDRTLRRVAIGDCAIAVPVAI